MKSAIALALLLGCHRGHDDDAGVTTKVTPASVVSDASISPIPRLPRSPDGADEVRGLEAMIAGYRKQDLVGQLVGVLQERQAVYGRVEDYLETLETTTTWTKRVPDDPAVWGAHLGALSSIHRFADARALVPRLDPSSRPGALALLAEATGDIEAGLAYRAQLAKDWPKFQNIAAYGAALAAAGRIDEALAQMKLAATRVHDNAPSTFAWYLFQYGRVYELAGELATARTFYVASRERMVTLEATVHLLQTMIATGDTAAATALARTEAAANPHPDLLALAGRTDEARAAWERYVAALPEAFSDHAARFYLAAGNDPKRALVLAQANLANRDTREARALVVEAALAVGDTALACTTATPLAVPSALRAQRFLAWKAFARCDDRAAEATRLATDLGIHP